MVYRSFAAITFFFALIPFSAGAKTFSDIPATHVHYEAITWAEDHGIISGYPDGSFQAGRALERAEVAKIIGEYHRRVIMPNRWSPRMHPDKIEVCPGEIEESGIAYSDARTTDWFFPYLCHVSVYLDITGYLDGTFRPSNRVNFSEFAKFVSNAKQGGSKITQSNPWYEMFVTDLEETNAIPLSITRFDQDITRGEAVEIIWRNHMENLSKRSRTYEEIGKASWFSEIDVCSDAPTLDSIYNGKKYPVAEKYKELGFAGELFTAYDCGQARLNEAFGDADTVIAQDAMIRFKEGTKSEGEKIAESMKHLYGTCHVGTCMLGYNAGVSDITVVELLKFYPYLNDIDTIVISNPIRQK